MTFIMRSFLFVGREGWKSAQKCINLWYLLLVFIEEKVFLENFRILVIFIQVTSFFFFIRNVLIMVIKLILIILIIIIIATDC